MKYSECPTLDVTIEIVASPQTVWGLVSDIELPTRFSSELRGVEWVAPHTEAAVDARFVGHSAHEAIGEWTTTCVVTQWDPGRVFEWTVLGTDGGPSSTWRFSLGESDGGVVQLTQWFRMGPGRGGLNFAIDRMPDKEERIVAKRLGEHRVNMERNLQGIKELAEAEPSGGVES